MSSGAAADEDVRRLQEKRDHLMRELMQMDGDGPCTRTPPSTPKGPVTKRRRLNSHHNDDSSEANTATSSLKCSPSVSLSFSLCEEMVEEEDRNRRELFSASPTPPHSDISTPDKCPFRKSPTEVVEPPVTTPSPPSDPVNVMKTENERWCLDMEDDAVNPLPSGWERRTHSSGMHIYHHKESRIATMARPFYVTGSLSFQAVPLSAIPCLHQERIEQRKTESEAAEGNQIAEIQRPEDYEVGPTAIREYAIKRFSIVPKTRRAFDPNMKRDIDLIDNENPDTLENLSTPTTFKGVASLKLRTANEDVRRRNAILPVEGRIPAVVLEQFVQKVLCCNGSVYDIVELGTPQCPKFAVLFAARLRRSMWDRLDKTMASRLQSLKEQFKDFRTVKQPNSTSHHDDNELVVLGRVVNRNAKQGKLELGKSILKVLLPDVVFDTNNKAFIRDASTDMEEARLGAFDTLSVDDLRVTDATTMAHVTKPLSLLDILRVRSSFVGQEMAAPTVNAVMKTGTNHHDVTVMLGQYVGKASGPLKIAKHHAAQSILKQMFPEVKSYGALLRLSQNDNVNEKLDIKKNEKDLFVSDQVHRPVGLMPNIFVIDKLKAEMARTMARLGHDAPKRPPISHAFEPPPKLGTKRGREGAEV